MLIQRLAKFINNLGERYCKTFHSSITRPVNNEYVCLECMRRYAVTWRNIT